MANKVWNDASGGWNTGTLWTPTAVPAAADSATLASASAYLVTIGSLGNTLDTVGTLLLDDPSAVLEVENGSTLAVTATLGLTAGTLELLNGTLAGATLLLNGGSFVNDGATFSGVTIDGSLATGSSGYDLEVEGGLGFTSPGGGLGTLSIGADSALEFLDAETLNNALILAPNATTIGELVGTNALTLGSTSTLEVASNTELSGSFVNQGTISVAANDVLQISGQFSNAGKLLLAAGSALDLTDIFPGTTAQLIALATTASAQGATLEFSGTLNNTGNTLNLTSAALSGLTIEAGSTIVGGTLVAPSGTFPEGVTLDGVTVLGGVTLGSEGISLLGSPVFETATGGTGGTIIFDTTSFAPLYVDDAETLNNLTISVGPSADGLGYLYLEGTADTIGANALLSVAPALQPYSYYTYVNGLEVVAGTLVNQGTIAVGQSGAGYIDISATSFANSGTLAIGAQGTLIEAATNFNDTGSITLTAGGLFEITGSLTTAQLNSLAGHISGTGGTIELVNTLNNAGTVLNAAGALGTLALDGLLTGGTLVAPAASQVDLLAGILTGVTVDGGVTLSSSDAIVYFTSADAFAAASGGGVGVIDVTGSYDTINLIQASLANLAILDSGSVFEIENPGSAVVFGTGFTLAAGSLTTVLAGAIRNAGLISAGNSAALQLLASTINNTGTIALGNHSTLALGVAGGLDNFADSGPITFGTGDTLVVAGTETTGNLLTLLSDITDAGSLTVDITGTLINTGSVIGVGGGNAISNLIVAGDLVGGTIATAGGTVSLTGSPTLDGLSVAGSLIVPTTGEAETSILDGFTLVSASGGSGGTLLVGSNFDSFSFTSLSLAGGTIDFAGYDDSFGSGTGSLSLGSNVVVLDTGNLEPAEPDILAAGTVFNAGSIAVGGSGSRLDLRAVSLNNTGIISVGAGAALGVATNLAAGQTLALSDSGGNIAIAGTLFLGDAAGTETAAELASLTAGDTDSTTVLAGTFLNSGSILSVGSAAPIGTLDLGAEVIGGTIALASGGLLNPGGTLDALTYQGLLDLGSDGIALSVLGGLTLQSASGAGVGTLVANGDQDRLAFLDSETLNNAVLDVSDPHFALTGSTLALGANLTTNITGGLFLTGNSFSNAGQITLTASGAELSFGGTAFTDTGDIVLAGTNESLSIAGPAITNSGIISVGSGDLLALEVPGAGAGPLALSNPGQLSVATGGTFELGGTYTEAQLASVEGATGGNAVTVELGGTLINSVLSAPSATSSVLLDALVEGGTVAAGSGTITVEGGTLANVLYQGPLVLGSAADVTIAGTLSAQSAAGGTPGTIEAGYATLVFGGAGSLDTALVLDNASAFEVGGLDLYAASTLTLGAHLTLADANSVELIAPTIGNAGTLLATGSNDLLIVNANTFTNSSTGTIEIGSTDTLVLGIAGSAGTLSVSDPGTISVASGGTVVIGGLQTTAQLATFLNGLTTNGSLTVELDGTLVNTGATLSVGNGQKVTDLVLDGDIIGGTIATAAGGTVAALGGTLAGLTFLGPLDVPSADADIVISNGLTLDTASGAAGGTLLVTGAVDEIYSLTSLTLPSGTIDLFGAGDVFGEPASALTLGTGIVVNAAAAATLSAATLVNAGSLAVTAGADLTLATPSLTNSGAVSVAAGATIALASDLTGGQTFSLTDSGVFAFSPASTLALGTAGYAASGVVTAAQLAAVTSGNSGITAVIEGTLLNSGSILSAGSASAIATLDIGAIYPDDQSFYSAYYPNDIIGGTIATGAGGLINVSGTLTGVTYQGQLNLNLNANAVTLTGGFTLETASGGADGTLFTSGDDQIDLLDGEALNNAVLIVSGEALDIVTGSPASGNLPLLFGAGLTATVTDGMTLQGSSFSNAGAISLTPQTEAALIIDAPTIVNTGIVSIGAFDTLSIDTGGAAGLDSFSFGQFSVAGGGTIVLGGTYTPAMLASVAALGGPAVEIELEGTLLNTGNDLLAAGSLDNLVLDGLIEGGTISVASGTVAVAGGTLANVVYQGPLVLPPDAYVDLSVLGSLSLQSSAGGTPGTLVVGNDSDDEVIFSSGTATLDNAVVQDAAGSVLFYAASSLALGSGLSLQNTGRVGFTAPTLSNAGNLSAAGATSSVSFDGSTLVNTGNIAITAGGTLSLLDATTSALTLVNSPTGSISLASGTTLSVLDDTSTAQLLALVDGTSNAGVFTLLSGSLNNIGAILPLSGVLDDVELDGSITGGTVAAGSGNVTIGSELFLTGVTYEGPLALTGPTELFINNGLSLTGASGSGAGTLVVTGLDDSIVSEDSSDVLANDVLLLAGLATSLSGENVTLAASSRAVISGTALITGGTFSNAGSIGVTGSLGIETTSFANTGAISVASTGILQLGLPGTGTPLAVSPPGSITLAPGSTIKLGGIATTSQLLALLGTIGDTGARVALDGEVINTGTSLAVATGGLLADLLINADVVGGSIVVASGSLAIGTTATFTGVTVDGPLNLKTDSDLTVNGSLTVVPNSGTLGRINFNGSLGIIDFLGVQTLDNVLVSANAADETIDGTTLTFGPGLTLAVGASASTTIYSGTFVNDGTIVSSGSLLTIDGNSIANAGVISIGAGDTLAINSDEPGDNLQNTGSFVLAPGATLAVGGDMTTDQLTSLLTTVIGTQPGVVVELSSFVTNNVTSTGTVIDALAGGVFGDLILDATITGGTIAQGSGQISIAGGAFDGVTYQGPLVLAGSAALSIEDGITLQSAAGSPPGNIIVTGTNNVLRVEDAEVLANAGLNVSGSNFAIEGPSTGTLTFAASLIPSITGQLIASAGALVNATNVSLNSAGSAFELAANDVFNSGTITAAAQTVFGIGAAGGALGSAESTINLFNTGVIALAAGTTLAVGGKESDAEIAALVGSLAPAAGAVILDGVVINSGSTFTVPASGSLSTVAFDNADVEGGTIAVAGGRVSFAGTSIFDGVTYVGPLNLGGTAASGLIVDGGLSVVSPTGGAASLSLGGTHTVVTLEDPTQTQSLNGLVVSIGSAGSSDDDLIVDGSLINPTGQTITMAGTGSALQTGEAYDSTIFNQGSIAVTGTGSLGGTQVGSSVVNTGVIAATSGSLTIEGGFSNLGLVSLTGSATVGFISGPVAAGTIDVSVGGETVALNGTVAPGGVFTADLLGFSNADVFDLRGIVDSGVSASLVNGTLEVTQGSSLIADLTLGGSPAYTQSDFAVQEDASGDAEIVSSAPCFCAGTMILTANGPRPVESLAVGDRVVTQSGALQPIVWIGQRRVDLRRHRQPELVRPVRIKAGAFAPGLPQRDLLVSPDHAIFADGVLIPARYLVNGATVVQQTGGTAAHYFHVELAAHDVLLAEGLPAESYLDTGNRDQFADALVSALHPDFAPRGWDHACAPLCLAGPALICVRRGLLARAAALGYRHAAAREVWLQLGQRVVRPVSVRGEMHSFVLPAGTRSARLGSASGVPAELDPQATDRRELGVAIAGVVANGRSLSLEGPVIGAGFHALERGWRWTDGDAVLEFARAGVSGKVVLALRVTGFAEVWVEESKQKKAVLF